MPVMLTYDIAGSTRFCKSIEMPGIDLTDPTWAISIHDRPMLKAHKQLPRRRDHSFPSNDLRSHYQKTHDRLPNGGVHDIPKSSTAPLNLPEIVFFQRSPSPVAIQDLNEHVKDDSSNAETTILRSRVATPTYQNSPPTPEITPPRPDNLLRPRRVQATAPSISSRAESFKTAKEELSSDDEGDALSPSRRPSRQRWLQSSQHVRNEDWSGQPSRLAQPNEDHATPTQSIKRKPLPTEAFGTFDGSWNTKVEEPSNPIRPASSLIGTANSAENGEPLRSITSPLSPLPTPPHSADAEEKAVVPGLPSQVSKSLRDRLRASASTEEFARDIGWSHVYKSPELQSRINSWRLSGISATSTIEAIVVDAETSPQRQHPLRHSRKNPSLRSTSSPFPASNRNSLLSNPDSTHRLIHKRGQITNKSRWSTGSEASRTMNVPFAISHPSRPEVIPVAVIPERNSSLQSSEDSSRRHSISHSLSPVGRNPLTAPDHPHAQVRGALRKTRPIPASLPAGGSCQSRGRIRHDAGATTLRGPSLSAPTSRSNSRANSLTSEHLRLRRLAAEEDLHRTLERMESERSVDPRHISSQTGKGSTTKAAEPDNEQWDALRSPSLYTAFSPPSMDSASPGPVEMGEAWAVNLFPHNNHSVQIINQSSQPESRAGFSLQKSQGKGQLPAEKPSTPKQACLPQLLIDSPLRNPRDPPQPPAVKLIPPTPLDLTPVDPDDRQVGLPSTGTHQKPGSLSSRFGSLKGPTLSARRRSESFVKSLSRTLSLRGARNMKANQPLDANLHPFWRPRGFWDDITDSDSDRDDYDQDMFISNSLGVSQKRTIIDGPISLVRHLSDTSRRHRRIGGGTKRSSRGSLSRVRAGQRRYKIPGLGRRFPFMRLGDMQGRLQLSKRQKEDGRRERKRQALREKIGPQIISTGDSRYPAYVSSVTPGTERVRSFMD